jgi:hypothetical protein
MSNKWYQGCIITPAKLGFLIQFRSGNKVVIKDAKSFEDCHNWIDRQLAHLAIEQMFWDK